MVRMNKKYVPRPSARRSPIWKMPSEDFKILVARSSTFTEILAHFGIRNIGHNNLTLKKRLHEENIDYSHIPLGSGRAANFKGKGVPKPLTVEECLETVFIKDSPRSQKMARTYAKRYNLIDRKCRDCGLTDEWNGKTLVLQLEHINGESNDNRLENLCWLCPNCHSQTPTYTGRGKRCVRAMNLASM